MYRRRLLAARQRQKAARATLTLALAAVLSGGLIEAHAQTAPEPAMQDQPTLREAFEAAWVRQPEAQAQAARRDAASAQAQAAQSFTPEPAAMELSTKSDRLNRNLGAREDEVGVAIPLWLPGQRGRSQALAEADGRAVESRAAAAKLRVAATVREAWWAWQRSRAELDVARGQLDIVRRIAADVGKRLQAGELARADQHQADGAVAAAESTVAQAESALTAAQQHLHSLTAMPTVALASAVPSQAELEPPIPSTPTTDMETHAELLALRDRAAVAEGTLALAATQSRASPELTITATRDRGNYGELYMQTVKVGVRIPFGAGPRLDARVASARAEAIELQAQVALERARLASEREAARARTDAARAQLAAADRRAQLALASRGFFEKSFRLGETDLPTLLRIEAEAAEAERQAARSRIELAAAISSWRQAVGLLPQ